MKKNTAFTNGLLFAALNACSLGILGIIDKVGSTQQAHSIIFSTQSVSFGFLFATIFALLYQKAAFFKEIRTLSFSSLRLIFFVGIFASGFFILLRFLGLTQSTGTFATLSQIIITAVTALLATIFLRERLSKTFWVLFCIIIIAMYFVSIGKFTLASLQAGDLYIIAGTGFVAVANILSKIVLKHVTPALLSVGRFFFGGLLLLVISSILFPTDSLLTTFSIWSLLSGLFWAINVIAFNSAVPRIGVTLTTSILMTAPVLTMILEYLLLKHNFNPIQIIAALVVITSGIFMVFSKPSRS